MLMLYFLYDRGLDAACGHPLDCKVQGAALEEYTAVVVGLRRRLRRWELEVELYHKLLDSADRLMEMTHMVQVKYHKDLVLHIGSEMCRRVWLLLVESETHHMNLPGLGTLVEESVVVVMEEEDIRDCKTFWQQRGMTKGTDLSRLARWFAFMSRSGGVLRRCPATVAKNVVVPRRARD